ncbi:DUF3324 domain-containing protein [Lactobacillus sp. ESL0684]|uniref:DUF3324 domain-containing protein n=1 Tax=Lactobacillus sp. ESL0684 TaxID=2983213 RepID=UPI0023F9AE46|nr:DUF3324 domain-containing protein [Lactobacillus sp. ESL0684]WEV43442.1 DUF3324 domain-containing protein [Lactobacillus sp. ESL0684]
MMIAAKKWFSSLGLMTLISLLFLINSGQKVAAAEGFSVKVAGQDTSYVERKVKPKDTIKVKLIFSNNSTRKQKLAVAVNTAVTGDGGVVQYNLAKPGKRYFGKHDFAKMTTGPKTIELAPHGQISKTYQIKTPKAAFKGVAVGGFYIQQAGAKTPKKPKTGSKAAIGYSNVYAYAIPIILRQSNSPVHTKLALTGATAKVINNQSVLLARIVNQTPTIFGQLTIKSKIIEQGTKRAVFTNTKNKLSMAPLSYFDYHIPLKQKLRSGNYQLQVRAQSGKRHWKFNQNFKINQKVAQASGSKTNSDKGNIWRWLAIGVGGVVMIALLIGMYYLGKLHSKK